MWPLCAITKSFVLLWGLFFYAQQESGIVASSPSYHKRRFNNLPFKLCFLSHTMRTTLCGFIQHSNLPGCCERATLQSEIWLSPQVLKWGLQKVNKLLFPLHHLPVGACKASLEKFKRRMRLHEGALGARVSSRAVLMTFNILTRWNNVAHRRKKLDGPRCDQPQCKCRLEKEKHSWALNENMRRLLGQ